MIDQDECPECGKTIDVDCDCSWKNCMACHGKGEVDATGDDIHWITCPKCLGGGLYPSPQEQEPDEDTLYESHIDREMEESL